ncbi:hypothetical protein fh0823_19090 [Francisella halioticida]|nr:hypothetical protein fh0823_19090 [Francisella halioticida]
MKTAHGNKRINRTIFFTVSVILRFGNNTTISIAKNINNTPVMKDIKDNLLLAIYLITLQTVRKQIPS